MLRKILLVLVGIIVIISYMSLYRILDTQCAVKIRVHQLLGDQRASSLQKPGIYFKVPFLDTVICWDTCIQHTVLRSMPLITVDDMTVHVDYQINWRVQNTSSYVNYQLKSPLKPNHLFLNWINEYLETHWQQKSLAVLLENQFEELKEGLLKRAKEVGIEIIDCKVMQKIPSLQSKKTILAQMKDHQSQTVDSTIKQAKIQAAFIEGNAKNIYAKKLAEAIDKAAAIEQEGEVAAMQLYTETYSKNAKFADIYQQTISEINSLNAKNAQLMFVQMTSPIAESV